MSDLIERLRGLTFIDETGEAADALEAKDKRIAELEGVVEAAAFWSAYVRIDELPERAQKPYSRFVDKLKALKGEGDE